MNNSHIPEALKDTQSLNQNNTNSVSNWNTMMTRGQLRKQNQKEETNNQTLGSENEKLEEEDKPQPSRIGNTTNIKNKKRGRPKNLVPETLDEKSPSEKKKRGRTKKNINSESRNPPQKRTK